MCNLCVFTIGSVVWRVGLSSDLCSLKMKKIYENNENFTIIARSFQSFIDFCDNGFVNERNVHCTFKITQDEISWMRRLFEQKGGCKFTSTTFIEPLKKH